MSLGYKQSAKSAALAKQMDMDAKEAVNIPVGIQINEPDYQNMKYEPATTDIGLAVLRKANRDAERKSINAHLVREDINKMLGLDGVVDTISENGHHVTDVLDQKMYDNAGDGNTSLPAHIKREMQYGEVGTYNPHIHVDGVDFDSGTIFDDDFVERRREHKKISSFIH